MCDFGIIVINRIVIKLLIVEDKLWLQSKFKKSKGYNLDKDQLIEKGEIDTFWDVFKIQRIGESSGRIQAKSE